METSETVLLRVKIDYADSIKQSAEFAQQISVAKDNLKTIEVQSGKTSEAYIAQQQEIKALEAQQRSINKSIQDSIKVNKASGDSYNALSGEVSLLTAKYRSMSEAERKSTEGKELQKDIFEKTQRLKDIDASMNIHSRNVGNYKDVFTDLVAQFKVGGFSLGQLKTGFDSAKDAIGGAEIKTASLNAVMKANVIGLIITGVAGLVAAFSKFDPYVDMIEQGMGALGGVLDVVLGRLIGLGRGIVAFITGDFSGGVDMIKNSFKGFGDSISKAAKDGVEFVKMQQDLEDQETRVIVVNSKLRKEIDQLLLKAKNRTISEQERLKYLDLASKKETEAFTNSKAIAEAKLELVNLEVEKAERNQKINGELLRKQAEAIQVVNDLERESIKEQERIKNRRDSLRSDEAAAREEDAKKQLEIQQKLTEGLLKEIDKRISEADKAEQEIIRKRQEAYAEQIRIDKKKYAEELKELANSATSKEEYEKKKASIEDEYLQQQIQTNKQFYESTVDLELEAAQRKLEIKSKEVADKQRLDQAEIQSAVAVANASGQLINQLAAVAEQGSEIQKFLALSNVAVNLGTAIGNLVATSSAPTPDNLITGGIAGFIKYAAGLTQILSAIGQARSIIGGAAAGGGDFMTKGPTLLLVGDNPGGVERVTVEPVSGRGQTRINPAGNLVAMAGGGTLTTYGGYAERRSGLSPMIDYATMAEQLSKIKIFTKITEIEKVSSRRASIAKISQL